MIRTLIIDDEPKSRSKLRSLLERHAPEISLLGEASNADEGELLIHRLKPQLVFLDVELPVYSGFDLLARFAEPSFGVVFCTGHAEYAISAIRCAAIDYLLKPIQVQELRDAVQKFGQWSPPPSYHKEQLRTLIQRLQSPERQGKIAVPDLKGISFVEVEKINYLKADNNYSELHLLEGKTLTSSRTLREYEAMLVEDGFFRVSKSNLVNLKYVKRYLKGSGGAVLMKDGTQLEVSRRRKEELLEHLLSR